MMAKNENVGCCLLCSCVFINLSISNSSFSILKFFFFNQLIFLFSSYPVFIQFNDMMVLDPGWCVGRISFYVSRCSLCAVWDRRR